MNREGGNQNGSTEEKLSDDSIDVFREGIFLILSRWSALQLAVENEWGGRGSCRLADQLASDIFCWFTQSTGEPLYIDDLENILDEAMLSLNTMIEDGSIEEVAEKLMIMHEECLEGNYTSVEMLRQSGPQEEALQHVRQVTSSDEDEENDLENDRMNNDASQMIVDKPEFSSTSRQVNQPGDEAMAKAEAEDGWVVASSRRSRGKRN